MINKFALILLALLLVCAVPMSFAAGQLNVSYAGPQKLYLSLSLSGQSHAVSLSDVMAFTQLKAEYLGANATLINLSVYNAAYLASNDINVTLTPSNGASPLLTRVGIVIGPDTPSGTYNVTVAASSSGTSLITTNVSLSVANPTNSTFRPANMSVSRSGAVQIITVPSGNVLYNKLASIGMPSNTPTIATTIPQSQQQGQQSGILYYSIAVVIVVVAAAALYLLHRKRSRGIAPE